MSRSFQRRFWVLLVSAAVAAACWKFLPGSALDRAAFSTVAGSYVNPPLYVSGNGTHASPWKLNSMAAVPKPDKREAPVVVSLGDDLENFFQSSPPAPIDLAVIFSNFHRLGARKAATAAVLAWEAPDPIGLAALDKALGKFDSLVMAAPLSRGAVPSAMPASFRRASLPLSAVRGDVSALPVVNRIPLPGVILGGENAMAGFSTLESEQAVEFAPLIARWEDRVVLAFPLITVLQRNNLPLDGVEIRLGESIKLGPSGPIVPLDAYGRLATPVKPLAPFKEISAEALIDGGDDLFPKNAPEPVILRDDQSAAEPATRAFSKNLAAMVAALASDDGFANTARYPRLPLNFEIAALAASVLLLTATCALAGFRRLLAFGGLAAAALAAQWIALGLASVWLPGLPILATISAAAIISKLTRTPVANPEIPIAEPEMSVAESEIAVAKAEMPVAAPETPIAAPEIPVAEPEILVAEPEIPIAEPEMPVAEAEMPIAEAEMPIAEAEMPIAEAEMPIAEPETSIAEPEMPIAESEIPIAEAEMPIAKPKKPRATAAKKAAAEKPAAKKAVAKKTVAKKAAAKKTAAKKTAAAKTPRARKSSSKPQPESPDAD